MAPVFVQARIDLVTGTMPPHSAHSFFIGRLVSSWEPHSLHLVLYRIMSCWPIGRTTYAQPYMGNDINTYCKNEEILRCDAINHSHEKCLMFDLQVSLMSRIIPSPDWFIGIDNFDLCVNGNWLDSITIEVIMSSWNVSKTTSAALWWKMPEAATNNTLNKNCNNFNMCSIFGFTFNSI